MIHVLICPHRLDYGGSQLGVYHWAKYLDKERMRVTILAMKRGGLSEKFENTFPVFYDDLGYPNVVHYIKQLQPDILHACPPGGSEMKYISEAAHLVPVTQTVMCPRDVSKGNAEVVRSAVLSKFVLSLQEKPEGIEQIGLPFDPSDYEIKHGREYFGLPPQKVVVGSLGNQRKENDHFMDIAWRFKNKDVHFVIKSNFKKRKYLWYKYQYLLGGKPVTIINHHLDENEKMGLFRCMDIFLYPTSNEAYGLVFLEAMSQKVPILSYQDSSMPEVIAEGGLLSPVNDKAGLMRNLQWLVENKERRKRIGERGYQLMVARNDPRKIAEKYEKLFFDVYENARRNGKKTASSV